MQKYTFSEAFALLNQRLAQHQIDPLRAGEARDYGIKDGMTEKEINTLVHEIREEDHTTRCEDKQARERGDFDHLSDYDS